MWKRILGLALCLLLAGCGASPAEETGGTAGEPARAVEPEAADWQAAYVKFLEDLCGEEKAVLNIHRPDYDPNEYAAQADNLSKEYFLYDLDWDGVPELVLRSDFYRSDIRVLTVRNGAAVETGRLDGRYMTFFTSPDRPGLIVQEIPKGPVFVFRLTLEDGTLRRGENLYETPESAFADGWDQVYRMEDIAPGAEEIMGCRTMAEWPEHMPLTLPVYDYGREEAMEPDPDRDAAARPLILAALENGRFCAVSGDGWGGDAGWTTLADYLRPGGITEYAEKPLVPRRRAWVDLDRDGRRECVLYAESDPEDYTRDGYFIIFSEQDEKVYAYCLNWRSGEEIYTDGVFCNPGGLEEGWGAYRVSFREEQCYPYTAACDPSAPPVEWEVL